MAAVERSRRAEGVGEAVQSKPPRATIADSAVATDSVHNSEGADPLIVERPLLENQGLVRSTICGVEEVLDRGVPALNTKRVVIVQGWSLERATE